MEPPAGFEPAFSVRYGVRLRTPVRYKGKILSPAELTGCAATMTVSTPYVTLLDLREYCLPRAVLPHHLGHRRRLLFRIPMIKVEHNGISLAAIHARVGSQIGQQLHKKLFPNLLPRALYVCSMPGLVASVVLGVTLAAVPVQAVLVSAGLVELVRRLGLLAT